MRKTSSDILENIEEFIFDYVVECVISCYDPMYNINTQEYIVYYITQVCEVLASPYVYLFPIPSPAVGKI